MKTLKKLKEHLSTLSEEELNKQWDEVEGVGEIGPTITEYLNYLKEINNKQELKQEISKQVTKALEKEGEVNLPMCAIDDIEDVLSAMGFDINNSEMDVNGWQVDFWLKYTYLEDTNINYTLSGSLWYGNFTFYKTED